MPPVDLETLITACARVSSDKKIACETLANAFANTNPNGPNQEHDVHQPDFPPESFWLSKDAEFDWFDRNAIYERKESQKGGHSHFNPNPNPNSTSNSQRFSSTTPLKTKASIIGLPKPHQKFDPKSKRNCNKTTTNSSWFPKRTGSVWKLDAPLCEPASPKVSCMGRVRSKRDRCRLKNRQGSCSESGSLRVKPERKQKAGLFSSFKMIFRSRKVPEGRSKTRDPLKESSVRKGGVFYSNDIRDRLPRGEIHAQTKRVDSPPRKSVGSEPRRSVDGEPFGLGGMKRFTSGRRSDAWIGDVA